MKITHSNTLSNALLNAPFGTFSKTLFASAAFVFSCSLIIAPTSLQSQSFGYSGIKGGYTYQKIDTITLKSSASDAQNNDGVSFDPFSASAPSFGVNIGWGSYFTPRFGFRLEAEYLYRLGFATTQAGWDLRKDENVPRLHQMNAKISLHSQTLLGNAYLDYYVNPSISLYASFGLGMSFSSATIDATSLAPNGPGSNKDKTNTLSASFAWQAGIGTAFALTESLWLDVNLRYIDLGNFASKLHIEPNIKNAKGSAKASAFEGIIGLNWRF